ncbi:MAG: Dabb family protein [Burkholderiales bacterium]|nr:Dabb family protein [Phycisphaerae bacterium]
MKASLILIPLLLLSGCKQYMMGVNSAGQVRHVVVCWLKPGADKAAVIASCSQLREIPGVVDVSVGEKLASDRPAVDSSYDLALVVTFDDERSLRAYDQHPIHLKALDEAVKPNVAKFLIYDSKIMDYGVGKSVDEAVRARRYKAMELQRDIVDRAH